MAVALSGDARKQALSSIRRYCAENLDLDLEIGDLQAASLLDFFLKEIAPSVYNAAIVDAQVFLRDRLADLEATCYKPEFVYWPKPSPYDASEDAAGPYADWRATVGGTWLRPRSSAALAG